MNRFKDLLRRAEFHGFVFCLGLMLFSYPLLIMSNTERPDSIYLSLFVPWGIIIALLFLITGSYIVSRPEESLDREDGDVTDV